MVPAALRDRDKRTIGAVNEAGYVPVRWTVDTLGWKGITGGMTAQQVSDRALAALRPGEIVSTTWEPTRTTPRPSTPTLFPT